MSRSTLPAFVQAWISSSTLQEVADKLGIQKHTASQIASRLRASGVPLPKFSRGWSLHVHSDKTKRYGDDTIAELTKLVEDKDATS